MNEYLRHKLNNIISGYRINEDDGEWLRALLVMNDFKAGLLCAAEIVEDMQYTKEAIDQWSITRSKAFIDASIVLKQKAEEL